GYATEAIRVLFQAASRDKDYQLFVLHDCDPAGYEIARTLREETKRMPGYHVDILDLGLICADAMDLGLDTEPFTRTNELPNPLVLTEAERRAFEGRLQRSTPWSDPQWIAERVELNAFTAPGLIAYIEERLQLCGVRGKVIPPEDYLTD